MACLDYVTVGAEKRIQTYKLVFRINYYFCNVTEIRLPHPQCLAETPFDGLKKLLGSKRYIISNAGKIQIISRPYSHPGVVRHDGKPVAIYRACLCDDVR